MQLIANMNNDVVVETDEIRSSNVQAKFDQLMAAAEKIQRAMNEVSSVNYDVQQMMNDPVYGHCLGEETRHYLSLSQTLYWQTHPEWSASLKFAQECVHLRNNDARVTKVRYNEFHPPIEYGRLIGTCLRGNTQVTEMHVQLTTLIGPDEKRIDENVAVLREYITTSRSLKKVLIERNGTPTANELATDFLRSIGANPSIEELSCYLERPPVLDLVALFSSSSSNIKKLNVGCFTWENYAVLERDLLPHAIATSQSINDLTLEACDGDCIMLDSILQKLTEYHTPIQKLSITTCGTMDAEPLPAVTHFLANTTSLKELTFSIYDFDTNNIEGLLEGLHQHYNREAGEASLKKLFFQDCDFDEGAATKFTRYMQSPAPSGRGAVSLQELEMEFPEPDDMQTTFAGELVGVAMASLILKQITTASGNNNEKCVLRRPTMGSQLQLLSLHPFGFGAMSGFLDAVTSRSNELHLPRLHLSFLGSDDCTELARCLPFIFSLRELHLNQVDNSVHPWKILNVFRNCGGLRTMCVTNRTGDHFFLTNGSHRRIMEAYCKRNEFLWTMLSTKKTHWVATMKCAPQWQSPLKKKWRQDRQLASTSNIGSPTTAAPDEHVLLLPTMLQVAKQVSITQFSTILSALLVFEVVESLGRDIRSKLPTNPEH